MKQSLIPSLKYNNVRNFVVKEHGRLLIKQIDKTLKISQNNVEVLSCETKTHDLYTSSGPNVLSGQHYICNNEVHLLKIDNVEEYWEFQREFYKNIALSKCVNLRKYFFIDLDKNAVIKSLSFEDLPKHIHCFNDKVIICILSTSKILDDIRVFDFGSGNLLWQFDALKMIPEDIVDKLDPIINISIPFVFHKDLLIFTTYKTLTALNVNTGELVYNKEHKGHGSQMYENGIIYSHVEVGLTDIFSSYKADTGELIVSKTIEKSMFTTKNESLSYTEFNLTEKHLIITYRAGIHIVLLNKETLEIEHIFNIKQAARERKASIPRTEYKPVLQDERLYQLLGSGELMVFDMEGLL